jgi:universal stress protein E
MGLPAPQVDAETMERLKTYHQRALSDLAKQFDIAQDRLHLLSGDAASAIETYVEDNDVDLVVAGAVSRGVLERLLIGSTAEELLDSVGSDILIVKPADISTKKGS